MAAPLPSQATARIATSARALGFAEPPVSLRLKLVDEGDAATLLLRTVPAAPFTRALDWLSPIRPATFDVGADHVLRARISPVPDAWAQVFHGVRVDLIRLEPDGAAVLTATGQRPALAALAARLGAKGPAEIEHVAPTPPRSRLLTPAQEEAVRAAVSSGYYDIPRPLTLQALARQLGVTSAALSERLRRAEGRIIKRYTRQDGADPWSAEDDEPPGRPKAP